MIQNRVPAAACKDGLVTGPQDMQASDGGSLGIRVLPGCLLRRSRCSRSLSAMAEAKAPQESPARIFLVTLAGSATFGLAFLSSLDTSHKK